MGFLACRCLFRSRYCKIVDTLVADDFVEWYAGLIMKQLDAVDATAATGDGHDDDDASPYKKHIEAL